MSFPLVIAIAGTCAGAAGALAGVLIDNATRRRRARKAAMEAPGR